MSVHSCGAGGGLPAADCRSRAAAGCRLAGSAGAPAARWVADESGHAAVDGGRLREGRERGGAKPARLVR